MKTESTQTLSEEEKLQRIEEMRLMGFDSQMRLLTQRAWIERNHQKLDLPSYLKAYEIAENGEVIRPSLDHLT